MGPVIGADRELLERFHGAEPLSLSLEEKIVEDRGEEVLKESLEAGQMDVWRGSRSSARVVREDSN